MAGYLGLFVTVVAAAALLQGFTGFGAGLVVMGVMTQFVDVKPLIPQVALVNATMVVVMLAQLRAHLRVREALPLCVSVAVGTFVGAMLFIELPAEVVRRTVGGVLVAVSVMGLVRPGVLHFLRRKLWAYPVGFVGGCMSAFNTSGPPLIHYAYAQDWKVEEKKMILQVAFAVSAAIRLVQFTAAGYYTGQTLLAPAVAIPVAVGGAFAGHALSGRLKSEWIRRAVYALLVVLGLMLVLRDPGR